MIFSVIRSQLLIGTNELKIVLNWKIPHCFAKTKVTYETESFCNFLRCG